MDNERFRKEFEKYKDKKPELRKELGLPVDKTIILTSGKYVHKKRPMDLLKAYHQLNDQNTALVFLGEGEFRAKMEEYIKTHKLEGVYLTGFKNQSEVGKYFAASDIFVLPSGEGETWGLVVNEAMVFGLPVIVSNIVGCYADLVSEDSNGYSFETGNIADLKSKLASLISGKNLLEFGQNSQIMIERYSYNNIIAGLTELK